MSNVTVIILGSGRTFLARFLFRSVLFLLSVLMVGPSLHYGKDAGKLVPRDKHVITVVAGPEWIGHVVVMGFGRRFGDLYNSMHDVRRPLLLISLTSSTAK